jgi:hypothetical protein
MWTEAIKNDGSYDEANSGIWVQESKANPSPNPDNAFAGGEVMTATEANSGGLFGGAAIVNANNGTMFSYDAKAIQGFEAAPNGVPASNTQDGVHFRPGTIYPSLNSGGEVNAVVFQDGGITTPLVYTNPVDAVSAVFMHDTVMNEYVVQEDLNAGTEWILTFPTRNFYVDATRMEIEGFIDAEPEDETDPDSGWTCTGTVADEDFACVPNVRAPFTALLGAELCEVVNLQTWDREEDTFVSPTVPGDTLPPVVSPAPPQDFTCEDFGTCPTFFDLCNEVNVLRFGENSVFGTPTFDVDGEDDSLLLSVEDEFESGWGRINLEASKDKNDNDIPRLDEQGLVGLPVTGFAAYEYENGFLEGPSGSVKANYGGLFQHKTSVLLSSAPVTTAP